MSIDERIAEICGMPFHNSEFCACNRIRAALADPVLRGEIGGEWLPVSTVEWHQSHVNDLQFTYRMREADRACFKLKLPPLPPPPTAGR